MDSSHVPDRTPQRALSERFGLPFSPSMQDWEWEVADASRFDEFVDAFLTGELRDDELVSLMEILVQCTEDAADEHEFVSRWVAVEPLLRGRPRLHEATIQYWACLGEADPEAWFRVSPRMRAI